MILRVNSVNKSIFAIVNCGDFFEVRTEFLIIFQKSSASKR
jgi:hypothetical protein